MGVGAAEGQFLFAEVSQKFFELRIAVLLAMLS